MIFIILYESINSMPYINTNPKEVEDDPSAIKAEDIFLFLSKNLNTEFALKEKRQPADGRVVIFIVKRSKIKKCRIGGILAVFHKGFKINKDKLLKEMNEKVVKARKDFIDQENLKDEKK